MSEMTPRQYWNHYTENNGGPVGVANKLGVPESSIFGICNGTRGIGRRLASRMKAADPLLNENILIWVTADPAIALERRANKQKTQAA